MKFRLPPNSLFAVLLRSQWWISIAVAAGLFAAARLLLPELYAAAVALPFALIGIAAGWRQLRTPGAGRVAAALERLRELSWEGFCATLEEAFRREGYSVRRLGGAPADLELVREGRVSLVGCKRWKAMRTGVEPLREFHAACRAREAHERIYVAAGEVTDKARAFAAENNIRLLHEADLARLLARVRSHGLTRNAGRHDRQI
jgi:restriction system protein